MKKRRARRKYYNWEAEIAKGNTDKFYHSTDFQIAREKVLERDKYKCQFFLGVWNDGVHFPDKIKSHCKNHQFYNMKYFSRDFVRSIFSIIITEITGYHKEKRNCKS